MDSVWLFVDLAGMPKARQRQRAVSSNVGACFAWLVSASSFSTWSPDLVKHFSFGPTYASQDPQLDTYSYSVVS